MQAFLPVIPKMVDASFGDLKLDGKAPIDGAKTSNTEDFSHSGEETPFSALLGIMNDQMPPDPKVNGHDVPGKWDSNSGMTIVNAFEEMAPGTAEARNPNVGKPASFLEMAFRTAPEEQFFKAGAIESQPENLPNQTRLDVKGDLSTGDFLYSLKLSAQAAEETIKDFPIHEMADDSGSKMEKNTLNLKDISQRFMLLDKDSTNIKALEFGFHKNEDGQSFLNGQSSQSPTDIFVSKQEDDAPQKPLQTQILTQIVEKAVLNLRNGQTEIKIHLKPEYLGHLRMQISTENQQVMLKMLTDVPIAKEIIESNIHHLKAALQSHGLEIEEIDVCVSNDSNHSGDGLWSHEFQTAEMASQRNAEANGFLSEDKVETIQLDAERTGLMLIDFFA
jgi:hypothetical protein